MDVNSFVIGYNKGKASAPPGIELNLHYDKTTPPEDTTKIWVKSKKPDKVVIGDGVYSSVLTEKLKNIHCESGSAKIGGKIYAFGGIGWDGGFSRYATCFDTEAETIVNLPNVPYQDIGIGVVQFQNKLYLFGGNSSKYVYAFDAETNVYEKLEKTMTSELGSAACEIVGSKVYFLGGCAGNFGGTKNTIYRFDIETNDFNILEATLRQTAAAMASVAVGTKIYVFGGYYNSTFQARKYAYCFDTDTETIVDIEPLPVVMGGAGCVEINGYIYIIGGNAYSSGNKAYSTVYRYDIANNKYDLMNENLSLSKPKSLAFCEEVNENIYIIGGYMPLLYDYNNPEIEILTVLPQVKQNNLQILTDSQKTKLKIINSEALLAEIHVSDVVLGNLDGLGESVEASVYKKGEWTPI